MVVVDFTLTKRLHRNCISCLSVFGDVIVTGGKDSCLAIVKRTPNSLETVRKISILGPGGSKVDVNGVDFGLDLIVCGSSGGLVSIYDVKGELCQHLPAHSSAVTCAKILDRDKWLLMSTSLDKRGKVWDVRNCKVALHELVGHTGAVVAGDTFGVDRVADSQRQSLASAGDQNSQRVQSLPFTSSRESGGASRVQGGALDSGVAKRDSGALAENASNDAGNAFIGSTSVASSRDLVTFGDQYPKILTVGSDATARLWNLNTNSHLAFSAPTLNVEACLILAKTPAFIFCIATDAGDLLVFNSKHSKPIATLKFPNEWITSMSLVHNLSRTNTHHIAIGTASGTLKFIAIELHDNFTAAHIHEFDNFKVEGVINAIFATWAHSKITTTLAVASETRLGRWYCTSAKNLLQVSSLTSSV